MAELRNNNNNNRSSSSSSSNTTSSRFSFLNRSHTTLHTNHDEKKPSLQQKPQSNSLERTVSLRGTVVKKLCSFFEPAKPEESLFPKKPKPLKSTTESPDSSVESLKLKPAKSLDSSSPAIRLPGTEDRIVLYFTSLRGIRRTHEDCYAVRMIFRSFRVWVDERDVSMDCAYKKELMSVLGVKKMSDVTLPQVFIRGRHVGGADVIKHLCEVGELGKILEGLPRTKPGFVCESCGDVRFVPCGGCSGSRKVFDEDEGLLKRCLECNENGLIRCPSCCSS